MLTIYTHSRNLFSREFWKQTTRSVLGKYSGPDAVRDSLFRGLSALGVTFHHNEASAHSSTSVVLSGIEALRENIKLRRAGKLTKLIAGPNITMHPKDAGGLLLDSAIDSILVPSKWVADFWAHEAPELAEKLRVWPSGTQASLPSSRAGVPILYDKLRDAKLLQKVQECVGAHRLFTYGAFPHEEYLDSLRTAPYVVYLARSESQGLALHEAWAHDVPTLVNKSSRWEHNNLSWEAPQINCPYLTPDLGAVFENMDELRIMIQQVAILHPKRDSDSRFSDEATARALLALI